MRLKFESLDYQDDAISSVIELFEGQSSSRSLFTVSTGAFTSDLNKIGTKGECIGNRLDISEDEILENLQRVQMKNGLSQTKDLHGAYDFDVEMETGTGKTYVYTKSMLRLNQEYGFTKFIIVVPNIAIKEGVYKSLEITKEHFKEIFNGLPYKYFVYNSDKIEEIRDFATDVCISIMIINIDAFRRSFDDPNDNSKRANIIHRSSEQLNGMRPIDLIREMNPIVIIDEPQSVDTTAKASDAISSLNSLCVFRYSATHIKKHNPLYRLDAVDAYEKKLVKGIDVAGFSSMDQHNEAYIKLISVDNKSSPITAKIEVDVASKSGLSVERKQIKVKKNDDLSEKTRRSIYEGYFVSEIYCEKDNEFIRFAPKDVLLELGNSVGSIDDSLLKRKMIAKTIKEHFDKEVECNKKGIKVLSLFFIDRVANYRNGEEKGPYAQIFEEEYAKLIIQSNYRSILNEEDPLIQAQLAHNGYFSGDKKKGGWKDSKENNMSSDDENTFNLIMKDKERLLSLNERMRFIFSHSALREGWDNPNVFQICTLNETKSEVKKRQEIGRGLRICVNQDGVRVRDPSINQLTVMANESYEEFAAKLQKEYEEDSGIRFGIIEKHTFANTVIKDDQNKAEYIGQERSEEIFEHFAKIGYIDSRGKVQDKLKSALSNNSIILPPEIENYKGDIQLVCAKIAGKLNVKNNDDKRKVVLRKEAFLSDDFKELWNKIKYRTKYNIQFDTNRLIETCVENLNRELAIKKPRLLYNKAKVKIDAGGVTAKSQIPETIDLIEISGGLPDVISYLQNRTDLTRNSLVSILTKCDKLEDFKKNPQMFMEQSAKIIMRGVNDLIKNGITYVKLGESEYYAQELFDDEELYGYLNKNIIETKRSLYEHTVYDSETEKNIAIDLDNDDHVKLFIKMPDWFQIFTPIGSYNPDWAVLMDLDGNEKLYFVFESKGNLDNHRMTEEFRIRCGAEHFKAIGGNVDYSVITSLKDVVIESKTDPNR